MAYMTLADGVSHITETIYPDRFLHAAELNRLNADISVKNGTATVSGVKNLSGAKVMARFKSQCCIGFGRLGCRRSNYYFENLSY